MLAQMMRSRSRQQEIAEATQETGTDPIILAAAASVVLSWYQFFLRGNREMGLFIGLWPPTILAFASYFEQTEMARKVDHAMGGSTIRDTVEQMMGNR